MRRASRFDTVWPSVSGVLRCVTEVSTDAEKGHALVLSEDSGEMRETASDGMQRILSFLQEFTETEYRVSLTRYDKSLDARQQELGAQVMLRFYHTVESVVLGQYVRHELDLTEAFLHVFKNQEKVQKRVIFLVRRYHKPKLGDVLQRLVRSPEVYACYTGDDRVGDGGPGFGCLFYVAETDEGVRIIYDCVRSPRLRGWLHSSHMRQTQVVAPGKLLEVHRLTPPMDSRDEREEYDSDAATIRMIRSE